MSVLQKITHKAETAFQATSTALTSSYVQIGREVEKIAGGQIEKFEMALFVDNVLEPTSAVVEDFKSNNMVTKVCVDDVIDAMSAGEEVTVKMAAESTNFRVAPTSTIFAGADVSGGSFVIIQLDGD